VAAALARAVFRGFGAWQAVTLLLALNLGVALLVVAPFLPALGRELGHAPLAEGQPLLSAPVVFAVNAAARAGGRPSVLAPGVLLGLLQLFLAGGIARCGWLAGPFSAAEFFAASGRLFVRNLRLFSWSLLGLLAVGGLVAGSAVLLHALGRDSLFTFESLAEGRIWTVWSVGQLAFSGLCLAAWRLALDAARVLLWRDDLRRTRQAAWRGVLLVLRAPLAVAGFAALAAVGVLGVFLVARFRASLPEGHLGWTVLALLVGQLALWLRYAFQMAGTAFAAEQLRAQSGRDTTAAVSGEASPGR
jgi:hypothetical protein